MLLLAGSLPAGGTGSVADLKEERTVVSIGGDKIDNEQEEFTASTTLPLVEWNWPEDLVGSL